MTESSTATSKGVFVGFGASREDLPSDGDELYYMLHRELTDAGCFDAVPWRQAGYMLFVTLAFGLGYVTLLSDAALGPWLAALILIAAANVHAGFIAHEIGHGAVTRNRTLAMVIGQFFLTFLTALTYGHFQDIHTRHHAHCNHRTLDPDMQSGAFSTYLESALEKRGLGWLVTQYQAVLIWILVSLQGFTLKIDSLRFMCREPRRAWADWLVLPLHGAFWIGLPVMVLGFEAAALNYILLTWFTGPYLGAIFLVNHVGTRVLGPDDRVTFFEQQITTTRNLGASRIANFLFGGLNNHIEHHLFPTLPRAGLRRARIITRDFCRRRHIAYGETTWLGAAAEVSRYFRCISESARSIKREQRAAVALCVLVLVSGCAAVEGMATRAVADSLAESSAVYATDDDVELVGQAIPFGLKTIEGLLETLPDHRGLLVAAASGFTQYAYAYVALPADEIETESPRAARVMRRRAHRLYLRGRDYGLRALELDAPGFGERLAREPGAALASLSADHVDALYWTTVAWASAIASDKQNMDLLADLALIEPMMDRCLVLAETYQDGAAHDFMVAFEGGRHEAQGGGVESAQSHYARAMVLSGGHRMSLLVSLAEHVSVRRGDRGEFESLLHQVLAFDVDTAPGQRLANLIAQRRATLLLSRIDNYFLGD